MATKKTTTTSNETGSANKSIKFPKRYKIPNRLLYPPRNYKASPCWAYCASNFSQSAPWQTLYGCRLAVEA
ncbi:hypothetical protein F2Q69_00028642 [Brassica cretica]|uniref:Uncharacterized protein n=1 Tax=Brassica cretica TaxID=69181 RepID=A0A8S9S2Y0_BRACR|nr:hypothetical protein F2Q69_00028642 [Brassica cretica]